VDRHRFDANPNADPTFHFDADPNPDPTPSFTHVGNLENNFTLIYSSIENFWKKA